MYANMQPPNAKMQPPKVDTILKNVWLCISLSRTCKTGCTFGVFKTAKKKIICNLGNCGIFQDLQD